MGFGLAIVLREDATTEAPLYLQFFTSFSVFAGQHLLLMDGLVIIFTIVFKS